MGGLKISDQMGFTIQPRVGRLRAQMTKEKIDAIVCFQPENSFYLTGFSSIISSHPIIAVLSPRGDPTLLVYALRDDHARAGAWSPGMKLFSTQTRNVPTGPSWQAALTSILANLDMEGKTIGIEEEFIALVRARDPENKTPPPPGAKFVNATPLIGRCRLVKDPDEIANARIAAHIADVGMEAAIAALAGGDVTERDVTIASTHAMNQHWARHYPDVEVRRAGSSSPASPDGSNHQQQQQQSGLATSVNSGPRKFYHACENHPTLRRPQPAETVSVTVWAVANGMPAKLERTVCVGPIPSVEKSAITAVLGIRDEIEPLLRPGTPFSYLYGMARKGYNARGYGANLPGRIGHTVGFVSQDQALIDGGSSLVLEPGMIIMLEPHLHISGLCATQYSDTVLITETGHEYLTHKSGHLEV